MKCGETEPSQATGSGGCVGSANLIGRFRLAPPSSLTDGAFGIAVLHLTKSAQSGLKIPQTDRISSMRSAYLTCCWRALQ
jgi:hypothetical protein